MQTIIVEPFSGITEARADSLAQAYVDELESVGRDFVLLVLHAVVDASEAAGPDIMLDAVKPVAVVPWSRFRSDLGFLSVVAALRAADITPIDENGMILK